MAAWTPRDLTNPSFVATNLSSKDRSYALYSVNSELPGAQARLSTQEAAWLAAQEAWNNGPARGDINALKAKAADTTLPQAERDAAGEQAAALKDQRDKLAEAEYQAMLKYQSTKEYVDNLQQGQNNLLSAGTQQPGVNMFAAPPGYEERSSPAAQVPDSQNPTTVPAAPSEQLQSISPASVSGPTGTPYDDEGNLNPGWGLDEEGNPVWIAAGYNDATGETAKGIQNVDGIQGPPYDDNGNLMPGWSLDEENNPVWVGGNFVEPATAASAAASRPAKVDGIQGPPYDDEGNLMPGWSLDEENNPVWVGNNADGSVFVEPATQASAAESRNAAKGLAPKVNAQSQATQQDVNNFYQTGDWRVRLSLAPGANYLYKDKGNEGILLPLAATNGVLFPYTPAISVNYAAHYDPFDLTHSNYKAYQYKSSSVDQVSITCDFTAQDTFEANYLLAVIHFFRSVTKMFYGQDKKPDLGTPPPLCYLTGLGSFQFDRHPLAITAFNYTLPTDVDYIRAGSTTTTGGVNKSPSSVPSSNSTTPAEARKAAANVPNGGQNPPPDFKTTQQGSIEPTYVPTKMQIQISAVPIVSRNDISKRFSLREYGTGKLLRGTKNNTGGIW